MALTSRDLTREEVRGIFVLGIIGTLLVLMTSLGGIMFTQKSSLQVTVIGLLIYWSVYAFLMAIGVSDDIIDPRIAGFCKTAGSLFFVLGISVTIVFVPLVWIADWYIQPAGLPTWVNMVIGLVFVSLVTILLRRNTPSLF
jgi:hypothetical protein